MIFPTQNPSFLTCPSRLLAGNKGFPIILLILEHKIQWFLLIFWVFSRKNDAEYLARITIKNVEVEPDWTISPLHRLISYCVDVRRSDVLRKKIIYRDKTGFDTEKFIEDSTVKIRSGDVRCECTPNILSGSHNPCVNCYIRKSKEVFSVNYSEKCPIVEKQIVIRSNAKWFNKELLKAKRREEN